MDIPTYDPMAAAAAFDPAGWQRSPRCGPDQGDCVEINFTRPGLVAIRDTKLANSPALVFTVSEWNSFTSGLHQDDFQRG
ncbi:DUF397 domain-containing protein [Amycolatopsis sp. NBC_01307]|uniref:DUF397 domain-containing protein n=1 Tax=Amycolatopsis sp. NBC_01307 TaxID=2903561 RepID=UPI002E12389D|nr:DUF397 domain-containing protein [Amycolatopsis sp. NBC_01307]